jgi:hypothetical protein
VDRKKNQPHHIRHYAARHCLKTHRSNYMVAPAETYTLTYIGTEENYTVFAVKTFGNSAGIHSHTLLYQ